VKRSDVAGGEQRRVRNPTLSAKQSSPPVRVEPTGGCSLAGGGFPPQSNIRGVQRALTEASDPGGTGVPPGRARERLSESAPVPTATSRATGSNPTLSARQINSVVSKPRCSRDGRLGRTTQFLFPQPHNFKLKSGNIILVPVLFIVPASPHVILIQHVDGVELLEHRERAVRGLLSLLLARQRTRRTTVAMLERLESW